MLGLVFFFFIVSGERGREMRKDQLCVCVYVCVGWGDMGAVWDRFRFVVGREERGKYVRRGSFTR